jgi:hypothetical protein
MVMISALSSHYEDSELARGFWSAAGRDAAIKKWDSLSVRLAYSTVRKRENAAPWAGDIERAGTFKGSIKGHALSAR